MSRSETPLRVTELRHPGSTDLDLLTPAQIVALFAREDATVPVAVARSAPAITRVLIVLERVLRSGGRLFYVGAGTSGRLGVLDASECPPTFGSPPELVQGIIAGGDAALVSAIEGAEDDPAGAILELERRNFCSADFLLGIAASAATPFVIGALRYARELGASNGLLACAAAPPEVRQVTDEVIQLDLGPELLTGSTRLKAGTATKLVLNTLTTGVMVRLGKTWGNLMVDLQATNAKLRDRGERMVMEVAGVERSVARSALDSANQQVRTAIVMARLGVGREVAEARLAEVDYRLRAILGPPPGVVDG